MDISIKWNICRVCLIEENAKDGVGNSNGTTPPMKYLFQDDKLAKQIFDCSGILMQPNDNLPQKICKQCLTVLRFALNFRTTCRNSDKYLNTVVQQTKSATSLLKLKKHRQDVFQLVDDALDEVFEDETDRADDDYEVEEDEDSVEIANCNVKRKRIPANSHNLQWALNKKTKFDKNLLAIAEEETPQPSESTPEQELNATNISPKDLKEEIKDSENDDDSSVDSNSLLPASAEQMPQEEINELLSISNAKCVVEERQPQRKNNENRTRKILNREKDNKLRHSKSTSEYRIEECIANDIIIESDNLSVVNIITEYSEEAVEEEVEDEITTSTLHANDETFERTGKKEEIQRSSTVHDSKLKANNENLYYIISDDIKSEQKDSANNIDENADDIEFIEYNGEIKSEHYSSEETIEYLVESDTRSESSLDFKEPTNSLPPATMTAVKKERPKQKEANAYTCDVCGNQFTNRNLLNFHMKIHRNEKSYECELCFKRFNAACNLTAHMRIHTGEKPYGCQYCPRRFTDRSTHIKHERIHTNEKPYICSSCGKAFSLSSSLKAHEKIHTGEKPYRCDPCAKSFKLPHQLKAHLSTHLHKLLSAEQ